MTFMKPLTLGDLVFLRWGLGHTNLWGGCFLRNPANGELDFQYTWRPDNPNQVGSWHNLSPEESSKMYHVTQERALLQAEEWK